MLRQIRTGGERTGRGRGAPRTPGTKRMASPRPVDVTDRQLALGKLRPRRMQAVGLIKVRAVASSHRTRQVLASVLKLSAPWGCTARVASRPPARAVEVEIGSRQWHQPEHA